MLADVADEVQETVVLHPVVVVDEFGTVRGIAVEIEEFGELFLYGLLVVAKGFLIDELALLRFHRWVANHAGGAADECNRTVSRALEMLEHHHAHQMAYMQ